MPAGRTAGRILVLLLAYTALGCTPESHPRAA
jgi:hypothetical protein